MQQRNWHKQRIKVLMDNGASHVEIQDKLNVNSSYLDALIEEMRRESAQKDQVRFCIKH